MSTTLLAAEQALSKELGDYWAGTTTSNGTSTGTTVVDTALKAKANDWITNESYDMLTSGDYGTAGSQQERKISSLDNSSGTLTVLAHGGQIVSSVTYRVHRLFEASEKRRALIAAAKNLYPSCFKEIRDESLVSGNWLKDGSFEIWTNTTTPVYWTATTVTATQTSTGGLYKHGSYSCKLSGSAGTLTQSSITNNDDLKRLAGKSVIFTVQVHSTTATIRLSIYDGTTTTYSSYSDANSAWTENNDPLEVEANICDNPTEVTFAINYASGTAYVDDARVISGDNGKIYIGNLGLAQNKPHQVLIEPSDYYTGEPWYLIRDVTYDTTNGYMYLPSWVNADFRLRVLGIGYLDFLASGAVSTTWEATIALDAPQLEVLIAEAALYLYSWMAMPNYESGARQDYQKALAYWKNEATDRKAKFGMKSPGATVSWGVG